MNIWQKTNLKVGLSGDKKFFLNKFYLIFNISFNGILISYYNVGAQYFRTFPIFHLLLEIFPDYIKKHFSFYCTLIYCSNIFL